MWPWQYKFLTRNSKIFVELDINCDIAKLEEEFYAVSKIHESIIHPDIYHNGGWSGILLHAQSGDINQKFSGSNGRYEWTQESFLAPYTKKFCSNFGGELKRVRYLTLFPGYKVHWHFDNHESFESEYIRFHIPIVTNPRAILRVASKVIHMKKGVVCTCDFGFPHSLRNDGDEPRTHLVFDVEKKELSTEIAEMFNLYAVANSKAKRKCQFLYSNLFNKAFQMKFYYRILRRKIKKLSPKQ